MLINNVNKIDINNQFFKKYVMEYTGSRTEIIIQIIIYISIIKMMDKMGKDIN